MDLVSLFIVVLFLASSVHADTQYDTTCSVPTTYVNFVSSPDSRGTLDILWSCLFTIFACTWTIQHLNIPEQRDRSKEKAGRLSALGYDVKWGAKGFWASLKWMLATMVVSELILGKAIGDFFSARQLREEMRQFALDDGVEWGISHVFFANMGGFVGIVYEDPPTKKGIQTPPQKSQNPYIESTAQERSRDIEVTTAEKNLDVPPTAIGENADIESTVVEKNLSIEAQVSEKNPDIQATATEKSQESGGQNIKDFIALTAHTIYSLRKTNIMDKLPDITAAEIQDKSKGSIFIKAVAVIQVFWVSLQVIVRSAKGLAISQLELVVTAFSVCAIITYLFLIPKPQGVQIPMRPLRIKRFLSYGYNVYLHTLFIPSFSTVQIDEYAKIRIPNDTLYTSSRGVREDPVLVLIYGLGLTLGGAVFGAIHVAGWNLMFPTPIERELWRISSIIMTCVLPLSILPLFLFAIDDSYVLNGEARISELGVQVIAFVFGVLYIASRLFILVETFRTLVHLPPDAYISTWASNIPQIG